MIELGQDIVVTLVAASAVTVLGRRVFGAVRPAKPGQPACPSCASGAAACARPTAPQASASADTHPLTLVRKA
jgi:hypothetical protein